MTFQGGDPGALRHLLRLLELDAAELMRSRRAVEPILTEVCVATAAGADLGRAIDEVWTAIGAVMHAVHSLEAPPPALPLPPVFAGPPTTLAGGTNCPALGQDVGSVLDVLIRRLRDLDLDVRNLRELRPDGPFSYDGHMQQAEGRQQQLKRKLDAHSGARCPDSLTIEIARLYAQLDIRKQFSWPGASAIAAHGQHRGRWHVDLAPIGRAVATGAGAVAAAAGAVAAAARAAGEAAPAAGL